LTASLNNALKKEKLKAQDRKQAGRHALNVKGRILYIAHFTVPYQERVYWLFAFM